MCSRPTSNRSTPFQPFCDKNKLANSTDAYTDGSYDTVPVPHILWTTNQRLGANTAGGTADGQTDAHRDLSLMNYCQYYCISICSPLSTDSYSNELRPLHLL